MTGYIRFILAIVVLLSHIDVRINGLNPGVIAVIIFYMLAGGVVSHLWHDILPEGKNKLRLFYQDRFLRIFPLYLYTASLTLIFLIVTSYGTPDYSVLSLLNNALIIPLNYYMILDSTIMTAPAWNLIPPAWSLGTELQAYLLLPLALTVKKWRITLIIISLSIYMAANLNLINTDHYGYRLLPGVFFIFLLGSYMRQWQKNNTHWQAMLAFTIVCLIYIIISHHFITSHYAQETLLGIMIGIPLLTVASHIKLKLPYSKLAGTLSYGLFLSHFLVIWMLDYAHITSSTKPSYAMIVIFISVVIAWIGNNIIEKRINPR